MTARREPGAAGHAGYDGGGKGGRNGGRAGGEHRTRPPLAPFLRTGSSRFPADMRARTAYDTVADDCAMGFLGELDEALWILDETQKASENTFEHAARKRDHIEEFRRLTHRLHAVLAGWEQEAATDE